MVHRSAYGRGATSTQWGALARAVDYAGLAHPDPSLAFELGLAAKLAAAAAAVGCAAAAARRVLLFPTTKCDLAWCYL